MKRFLTLTAIFMLLFYFGTSQSFAAGVRPILKVNCGDLLTLTDKDGEFKYFNPTVTVSYSGKYLKYWVYESAEPNIALKDQSRMYGTETRDKANAFTFGTSDFNWSRQLRYNYVDSEYTEIYMVVKDSMKRTSTMKCIWQRGNS